MVVLVVRKGCFKYRGEKKYEDFNKKRTRGIRRINNRVFNTKTGGVGGVGYKMGGSTGSIKQAPAGYKDGGHVAMSCKDGGGFTAMKKMSKC